MGSIFRKPEPVKIAAPEPEPEVIETETITESAEQQAKSARRRKGYAATLITGSLVPTTGKKTVLG